MANEREGIVAFAGGGIGDVVFHIGHFQALAARARSRRITIACKKGREIAALFEGIDFVDRVIGLADDQSKSGKVSPLAAAAKLRPHRFAELWSFHPSTTIGLVGMLAGIPRRVGFADEGQAPLFLNDHFPVPADAPYPPLMFKASSLLKAKGVAFDETGPMRPALSAVAAAESRIGPGETLVFGLNASDRSKNWGGEKFGALARELGSFNGRFILFGASDVAEDAARAIETSELAPERFVDFTRDTPPLGVSFAALARSCLYVGNDSSGLNLAVFAGTPAIGLFGATIPLRYSPLITVIEAEGMSAIAPADVARHVRSELAQPRGRARERDAEAP